MPKDVNVLRAVRNDPWGRAEPIDGAEFSNSRFQTTVLIFPRAPRVSCVFRAMGRCDWLTGGSVSGATQVQQFADFLR
jgi:hypothetical protein